MSKTSDRMTFYVNPEEVQEFIENLQIEHEEAFYSEIQEIHKAMFDVAQENPKLVINHLIDRGEEE